MRIYNKKSIVNILFLCASFLCLIRFEVIAAIPAYGFIFFGLFFLLIALNYKYRIRYSVFIYIPFILVLASVFFVISNNFSENSFSYYITYFSFPFIFYYSTVLLVSQIETALVIQNIKILLPVYFVYLFIEIIIRVFFTIQVFFQTGNILLVYRAFKTDSFAYSDANFLGLHILNIFCLCLFLRVYANNKLWTKYCILLFAFALFSLSRSVIITSISIIYLVHLYHLVRKRKYALILVEFSIVIIILYNLYNYFFNNDGSFRSKLEILDGMKNIYKYKLNNILCGFGFGKGEYAYSYVEGGYGHLHVAQITGQYGVLGIIIFIIFFTGLCLQTNGKCFLLTMAFFISGFSLMFFDSSLFWCLGIISVLYKRKDLRVYV